jgi:hypothetical protein
MLFHTIGKKKLRHRIKPQLKIIIMSLIIISQNTWQITKIKYLIKYKVAHILFWINNEINARGTHKLGT